MAKEFRIVDRPNVNATSKSRDWYVVAYIDKDNGERRETVSWVRLLETAISIAENEVANGSKDVHIIRRYFDFIPLHYNNPYPDSIQ